MKQLIEDIVAQCDIIKEDIVKEGNKAAAKRVRKATIVLNKLGKEYRKKSIEETK